MGTNHKTVPINHTVLLQGGLASSAVTEQPLIGATNGETLSKTALTVPGGLAGIGELELGGEVTATAELVGPPSRSSSTGSTSLPTNPRSRWR